MAHGLHMAQRSAWGTLDVVRYGHPCGLTVSSTGRIESLSTCALGLRVPGPMKNPAEAGFGVGRDWPVGAAEQPVFGCSPEAQIAYRGTFLPPSGKPGKGQFRGGSSLTGVQHEFDHSCAIDPDKRCRAAWSWALIRPCSRRLYCFWKHCARQEWPALAGEAC